VEQNLNSVVSSKQLSVNPREGFLAVMEDFYTVQGEGFHQGKAACFIRLAGCDVGCVWCDVKDSWNADAHPLRSIETLIQHSKNYPAEIVVITGGEPTMYNLEVLTNSLHEAGKKTHLETSGVYPVTGSWDWICVSPKKFKAPLVDTLKSADELKIIVFNENDLMWAEKFVSQVPPSCKLFLQPEWSKEKKMIPLMVDYIKVHPEWRISLQVHKYMNIP
jgi:7-carboxy-7-deazaguanine synthase